MGSIKGYIDLKEISQLQTTSEVDRFLSVDTSCHLSHAKVTIVKLLTHQYFKCIIVCMSDHLILGVVFLLSL